MKPRIAIFACLLPLLLAQFDSPLRSVAWAQLDALARAAVVLGCVVIPAVMLCLLAAGGRKERRLGVAMIRALLILLFALPAWGATYYVRDGGQCANNGDGSAPTCAASAGAAGALRNVSGLLGATFAPNDLVRICDEILLSSSFQPAATAESGTAGNPVVLDGSEDATCGPGGFNAQGLQNYAFRVTTSGPSHWTLRNLTFRRSVNDCMDFDLNTLTGWTLESVTIEDCGADGLDINNMAANGITLNGVFVYRAAQYGISCNNTTGGYWRNLRVYDSGTAGANNHDGLAINDGCGDSKVIEDVQVYRQKSESGGGIDLQDSAGTGTLTLRRAYIKGGEGAGFTSVCNAGTQTIDASSAIIDGARLNVYLKDCGGLHKLSNFTTINGTGVELKYGDSGTSGDALTAEVRNSSFGGAACTGQAVQYRDNAFVNITADRNQYCPGGEFSMTAAGTQDFAGWQTESSQDANSIEADPQFLGGANPTTARGFRLKSSSPLIGAGTCYLTGSCVYRDFDGRRHLRPPNIGAFATGFGDQK